MISQHIGAILVVTGVLTAGGLLAFVAPVETCRLVFGSEPGGLVGQIVARHWGVLLFCIGGLLVYAAFHYEIRPHVLAIAMIEKGALALMIFVTPLRRSRTAVFVAIADVVMMLLYGAYIASL